MTSPRILITGPTASGKGEVAVEVAERLDADLVSVDSMKVYREMDIVTAKPSSAKLRGRRIWLLDLVTPDHDFTVAEFHRTCRETLERLDRAGRPVVLVGGTSLYVKVLLEGLVDSPPPDSELRARLEAEAREQGVEQLHARLRRVDPVAARRIASTDTRRIVRFLEHQEQTGRPISDSWNWSREGGSDEFRLYGLAWERARLYERTDERVRRMVDAGLFEEASRLGSREPPIGRTAGQCIGLREIFDGERLGQTRTEVIALIQQHTRNFAKRQGTWFRKMPIDWIPVNDRVDAPSIAAQILARHETARDE